MFVRPENSAVAADYKHAVGEVLPLVQQWLGTHPKTALTIVDLPEPDDASFEEGPVLFTGMKAEDQNKLTPIVVHSLTHAYFQSSFSWLEEGVAYFVGSLWVERNRGREMALAELDSSRSALSLAEPGEPAAESTGFQPVPAQKDGSRDKPGESLIAAKDPIYYRTKATYVFWMLRDLAGDNALSQALQRYDPAADADGNEFENVLEKASGKDLKWFFADWVYHDRGLPDLSITGVYPSSASMPGSYVVAVGVQNSGFAETEVPVSVRSAGATVTARLRVPANSQITHRFLLVGEPVEVAVNDGTVPEVQASVHKLDLTSVR
jgi:aminopeptidase N